MNARTYSLACLVLFFLASSASSASAIAADTQPAATQPAAEPCKIVSRITNESGVTVARLDNGLTIIVKATRQAPVVCVRAYVHTGGIYEGELLGTGVSHLLEHLVAKGAVHDMGSAAAGQAKQTRGRVQEIGGQSNAYTTLDHTCYYISAAAGKTYDCIDLVADWMARPDISREDFDREHGVVQRELEMRKDDPSRTMWYAHSTNFFAPHPAGVPVIGYADPLANLTMEELVAYHGRVYVPQNMVFCVVGDVDVEAVLERTSRAFAGFAAGRPPQHTLPAVPQVTGIRRVVQPNEDLTDTMEKMSFRSIPLVHEDLYALDVLAYALTEGRSSRLSRKIYREKKLVTSISSSSWTPAWGAGMFTVSFRSDPNKADAAEQAILAELRTVVAEGITEDELERAKRQKVADFVYSQQTVDSIAGTLATDFLVTGDVEFSKHYTERIQAVTTEDILRMAKKYFDFDAMVFTRVVPPAEAKAATQKADEVAATESARPTMFTLSNGLRVVLYSTDSVGLVSMTLVVRGGLLVEDANTNGMGTLTAALSTKGAGDRSAEEISAFFARAGGGVSGNSGNNTLYWKATVLDDSFGEALDIFADVIIRPTFAQGELDIIRPGLETRIKRETEHWFYELRKWFRGKFFIDTPYSRLTSGKLEVIQQAKPKQIAEYHAANVRTGASVLAVYGNFDAAETRTRIEKLFAEMPEGDVTIPQVAARKVGDDELHILKTNKTNAGVIVAVPSMKVTNLDDRFALAVLDTIISGWNLPSGWLHTELRGKKLVYVVHAYNWIGLSPGAFMTYAQCEPDKAAQVAQIIRKNMRKAASHTPTQEDIDIAINTILTAELLDNQSMSALSMFAALDELYGFGYDFRSRLESHYRKVTPAEVLRVGQKYLAGGMVTIITTPQPEVFETPAEPQTEKK